MTRPRTPTEVFLELVHGVAAGRGADLAELYAENTNVIHPMSHVQPSYTDASRPAAALRR